MAFKGQFLHNTNCVNFIECPLCFKCRGYNLSSVKCQQCFVEKCLKETHSTKNINMMMSRPVFESDEEVTFINGGDNE